MSDTPKVKKPVVLCILDGWGERSERTDNAIAQANTPTWDRLVKTCPKTQLEASAKDVGLPDGQMGNSEVGHMNLGAGRVVMQDLPRIDQAVSDGSLGKRPALLDMIAKAKKSGGVCHLLGLLSPGGVHSSQDHMVALAKTISDAGVAVKIHAFLDGRDTPPASGREFCQRFESDLKGYNAEIATVSGRFYAMDRDNRWERVSLAYDMMVNAKGDHAHSAIEAIEGSYAQDVFDEFVMPCAIGSYQGMNDGDVLLMANFRADRAREILSALAEPGFDGFERTHVVSFADVAGMVEYSTKHNSFVSALFPSEKLSNILGEVVSKAGKTQLRIAETEKYAHVTFFLNGGEETVFAGEERILIPSPKVKTYDLQPEMSAPEVTKNLVEAIESAKFDLIVVNYANGDMVGHTGMIDAAIKAAEAIDAALAQLEKALKKVDGVMLITADHGNAEMMRDASTDQPHTAHTLNPVPAILVNAPAGINQLHRGCLADVAPTLLQLMGLKQPSDMTGSSLLSSVENRASA